MQEVVCAGITTESSLKCDNGRQLLCYVTTNEKSINSWPFLGCRVFRCRYREVIFIRSTDSLSKLIEVQPVRYLQSL